MRAGLGGALAATVLLGCAVDASLEGKRCPCAEGWKCDRARDVCERNTCDPQVRVSSLQPSWATAHSIRWQWEASGAANDFVRYELWLAENEADLLARSGTARLIDGTQNPDIADWIMPLSGDPVTSAITRGLQTSVPEAPAEYWAQLSAIDVEDCASESNLAVRRTIREGSNRIELFGNALLPGGDLQPADALQAGSARGVGELVYQAQLDTNFQGCFENEDTKAHCGQPLKASGFQVVVSKDPDDSSLVRMSEGTFSDAYLEMRVRVAGQTPAVFAGQWLTVGTCENGDYQHFQLTGFVIPNGDTWVALEVPLANLIGENSAAALTYDDLDAEAGRGPVCGFAVAGQWHRESVVRIDDVAIRF
jgi:hypothetical protein